MKVKNKVLSVLEDNRDVFVSGTELAEKLNVSRNAIWKAINSLKEDGYDSVSAPHTGYLLLDSNDLLSKEAVSLFLDQDFKSCPLHIYKTLASTNATAKEMALNGACDRTIVISEHQSAGRGRYGRTFFSPDRTGIYISFILRPHITFSEATRYTIYAAVATLDIITKYSDIKPAIKWVNDIYIGNKKCCGILTEATADFESGNVESLIIGIGINISTTVFPPELSGRACSICNPDINRNEFTAEIINHLFNMIDYIPFEAVLRTYKRNNLVLNKNITFTKNGSSFNGTATDIDAQGRLIVRCGNEDITLNSGEVSLENIF